MTLVKVVRVSTLVRTHNRLIQECLVGPHGILELLLIGWRLSGAVQKKNVYNLVSIATFHTLAFPRAYRRLPVWYASTFRLAACLGPVLLLITISSSWLI